MFTARYGLNPYKTQISSVYKVMAVLFSQNIKVRKAICEQSIWEVYRHPLYKVPKYSYIRSGVWGLRVGGWGGGGGGDSS